MQTKTLLCCFPTIVDYSYHFGGPFHRSVLIALQVTLKLSMIQTRTAKHYKSVYPLYQSLLVHVYQILNPVSKHGLF